MVAYTNQRGGLPSRRPCGRPRKGALPCSVLQHLFPPGPEQWCAEKEEGSPTPLPVLPSLRPTTGGWTGRECQHGEARLRYPGLAAHGDSLRKIQAQSLMSLHQHADSQHPCGTKKVR